MTNKYFNSKPDSIFEAAYNVLSEGKYVASIDNLKKTFKALSWAQNGLDVAIKDYNSIEGPGGHGSGHYQAAMNIEYYNKKVKENISAMIDIQGGLMERGEMTKQLQQAFIDELEDNVDSLQKLIVARDDNNYVLNSQLRERKAILARAKEDIKSLKESSCDDEESNINEEKVKDAEGKDVESLNDGPNSVVGKLEKAIDDGGLIGKYLMIFKPASDPHPNVVDQPEQIIMGYCYGLSTPKSGASGLNLYLQIWDPKKRTLTDKKEEVNVNTRRGKYQQVTYFSPKVKKYWVSGHGGDAQYGDID